MPAFFIYLLKVNTALLLFYLVYRFVLRRLTFYQANRWYLLFAIIASSAFPLISVSPVPAAEKPVPLAVNLFARYSPDWTSVQTVLEQPAGAFNAWTAAYYVYWLGVAVLTLLLLVQAASLLRVHVKSRPGGPAHTRTTDLPIHPFSFFRTVYINPAMHQSGDLDHIITHEAVHINEWHSIDIVLAELNRICYWFNPGVWLMRNAVRENLEFIADQRVLAAGADRVSYQYELLSGVTGKHIAPGITGQFAFLHLKNRIMMMNKKASGLPHRFRYFLLVPLLVVVVAVVAQRRSANSMPAISAYNVAGVPAAGVALPDEGTAQARTRKKDTVPQKPAPGKPAEADLRAIEYFYCSLFNMEVDKPAAAEYGANGRASRFLMKDSLFAIYLFDRSGRILDSSLSTSTKEAQERYRDKYMAHVVNLPPTSAFEGGYDAVFKSFELYNDLPSVYYMVKKDNTTRHLPKAEWQQLPAEAKYILDMEKLDGRSTLFVGIDNPLGLNTVRSSKWNFEFEITNGRIVEAHGRYIAQVLQPGRAEVRLFLVKQNGERVHIGSRHFPVRLLPPAEKYTDRSVAVAAVTSGDSVPSFSRFLKRDAGPVLETSRDLCVIYKGYSFGAIGIQGKGVWTVLPGEIEHAVIDGRLYTIAEANRLFNRDMFTVVTSLDAKMAAKLFGYNATAFLFFRSEEEQARFDRQLEQVRLNGKATS